MPHNERKELRENAGIAPFNTGGFPFLQNTFSLIPLFNFFLDLPELVPSPAAPRSNFPGGKYARMMRVRSPLSL
jgi:hypothetical protein